MSNAAHRPKRVRTWTRPCLAAVALIAASALSSCDAAGRFFFEPGFGGTTIDYKLQDQLRIRAAEGRKQQEEEARRIREELLLRAEEEALRRMQEGRQVPGGPDKREPGLDSYMGYTF